MKEIGLQLYSIKSEIKRLGFGFCFERLFAAGYTGVEFSGFYDTDEDEVLCAMNKSGLHAVGFHDTLDELTADGFLENEIRTVKKFGCAFITCCSGLSCESAEAVKQDAARLEKIGRRLKSEGITLCYHNHAAELVQFDGKTALDLMFQSTDPAFLSAEPDVRWLAFAGCDPADFLRRYSGRIPQVHLRQMADDEAKSDCPADRGILDLRALYRLAKENGTADFIYENGTGDFGSVLKMGKYFRDF